VPGTDSELVRDIIDEAAELGLAAPWIGLTGGDFLKLGGARAISIDGLKTAHEGWFPRFMGN
jgi:phosphoribosylformylglycinamidine synthase